MAKQTYTIKFGIDSSDFVRNLEALQRQLNNIAASMDLGLSADKLREFSDGLNSILKNYTTAISKQDFSSMQGALDDVYSEAVKIQQTVGGKVNLDGLLNSLGKAKTSLGEFRDMTTTVSGAAISAANNIAVAQEQAATRSRNAIASIGASIDAQKQKLADLQSTQASLASYADKNGRANTKYIKSSLLTKDYAGSAKGETAFDNESDKIKQTYLDLAKAINSIDWSKAAGDPAALKQTLSLLQQCSDAYRAIHSSYTQDDLENVYKVNGDMLGDKPIETVEQAFAKANGMSQEAAEVLQKFDSQLESVVDKFAKNFSGIYRSIGDQVTAQADVVKNLESGATAAETQAKADEKAAAAARQKADAERDAAAALREMSGTSHATVNTNSDTLSLASARQHTTRIKLSVSNQKEFVSQMQSAMAAAQTVANQGIKVPAVLSNEMIQSVTKKYSKSGATNQQVVIDVVAQERGDQTAAIKTIQTRLQTAASKSTINIPVRVKLADNAVGEAKKQVDQIDSAVSSDSAPKATIKRKIVVTPEESATELSKKRAANAEQLIADSLTQIKANASVPITFNIAFKPDLATIQKEFADASAAMRASASSPIQFNADLSKLSSGVSGSAATASAVAIPVTPDAESFIKELPKLSAAAASASPITIPVVPNTTDFAARIKAAADSVGPVSVNVTPSKTVANGSTNVTVALDPTSAISGFSSLMGAMKTQGNVTIHTVLDSKSTYAEFSALIAKMRSRTTSNPVKVHLAVNSQDLQDQLSGLSAAYNAHIQSVKDFSTAEGNALDAVTAKAKDLRTEIMSAAQQIPTLIQLLQIYQKSGGGSQQSRTATTAKSAARSALNGYQKYSNESSRVLGKIGEYGNYNAEDVQLIIGKIQQLNTELVKARNNVLAITHNKNASPDDVTRALDGFNVKLTDTRAKLRDAANDAAQLNREFVSLSKDSENKVADVSSSLEAIDKYVSNLPEQKIEKFYNDISAYTQKLRKDGSKFIQDAMNPASSRADLAKSYDDFQKYYRVIWRGVQKMSADKSYNMSNPDKVFTKGNVFADNVNSLQDFQAQVQQRLRSYKEFNGDFINGGTQWVGTYRDATGAVRNLTLAMDQNNQVAREYASDIKKPTSALQQMGSVAQRAANYIISSLATFVSFRMVINYIRTGVGYVQQLDTALAQLQIVTGQSSSALKEAEDRARSIGDAIGSTTTEVLNSATDWARLGYSMSDSLTLAQKSAELAKTGFMDVATATEQMTSAIQAFYGAKISKGLVSVDDAASHINDELVQIGNNMPITSQGLGDALERSAGSLVAAGNTLEESVALISTANSTIQNPESVGNALKTVSMRLRGKHKLPSHIAIYA